MVSSIFMEMPDRGEKSKKPFYRREEFHSGREKA
jgi:hypothetical protein